jgi:lipoprotein-releasing system ATP-binding protein
MALLEAKKLFKSYRDAGKILDVLQGTYLSVEEKETVAITGESGCGKSTLLHLLGILDRPDSGDIYYSGYKIDFQHKQLALFRNRTIGFVFQFHYLLEDFSACENVAIPHFIASGNWKESLKIAKELLEKVDLKKHFNQYPNQLSGGEQQRVAVARALINKPEIVLADEPTGNLDPRHSDEIIDLIIQLNEAENCSFIIVTHNLEIANKMDTHYVLEKGRLTKQ